MDGNVSRLVFELSESDFLLARISDSAGCRLRLEEILPRSDGSALEYVSIAGADPEVVQAHLGDEDGIRWFRALQTNGDEALFEIVSETTIATALADHGSVVTNAVAKTGDGFLTVEIPGHVDDTAVIDGFLTEYPGAELVRREATNRSAPTMAAWQFRDQMLTPLTAKQLQALRTAHAAGYFAWPRETEATEIASDLGISPATFSQHLRVAMGKVFDELFEDLPEG